jgi:SAM-dependent methyltransferase
VRSVATGLAAALNYGLAYRIGFHPWEDAQRQTAFVDSISALVRREEVGNPPYGPALDLGTGSGVWAVWLAQRGWQVTAVDIVESALQRAQQRVDDAGVDVRIMFGDVTDLRSAGAGAGFRLLLDTGTFHGLSDSQRAAMAREVSSVAGPGATLLMLAWDPRRRGPLPRGADKNRVEAAFRDWVVTDEGPTGFSAPPPVELLLRPHERWYRISRN